MSQKVTKSVNAKTTKKADKKAMVKKPAKAAAVKKIEVKSKPGVQKTTVKAAAKKPVTKPTAKQAPVKKAPLKKELAGKVIPQFKKEVEIVKPVAKPVAAKLEQKPVPAKILPASKANYKVSQHVVYPTHGVGKIVAEETQNIGDVELRMLVIAFEKDKMTLRVPVHRATAAGLRPISTNDQIKKVFDTLKSRARTSRGMWSRRAQEYEAKINSGNILYIAEVVRDLHQNVDQSERSYSERMIYESALSRLVGELAAAEASDYQTANDKLLKLLRNKAATAAAMKEAA